MRILKHQSTGLIIDIQERLFPHIHDSSVVAHHTAILIKGFRALDIPILLTQQYTKGLGDTIPAIRVAMGEYDILEKISFSCCDDPGFMGAINKLGNRYVIIAGIEAHVCVFQTTLDLVENGYQPVVVEDCISSRKANDKKVAVERMRQEGAIITTYESILFELCRYAGTEEFKKISQLVK